MHERTVGVLVDPPQPYPVRHFTVDVDDHALVRQCPSPVVSPIRADAVLSNVRKFNPLTVMLTPPAQTLFAFFPK